MTLFDKIKSRIYKRLFRNIRQHRKKQYSDIPHFELSPMHLDNARLLVDRCELLENMPRSGIVAELGVAAGDFSAKIIELNRPQKLHLIDPWYDSCRRYGEQPRQLVLQRFAHHTGTGQVEIHRSLSTDIVDEFPDGYFDWIYIDTDHSYATTLEELRRYAPKIKAGGMIAGDDFTDLSRGSWSKFGVIEAVYQFCVEEGWQVRYLTMEPTRANPSFALSRLADRS